METMIHSSHKKEVSCFVIGNYGDYNIGDEMLLKQVIKEVSTISSIKFHFYVPARDVEFVKVYHQELLGQITPIYIKNFKKIFTTLASSKIVVVGGGGIWSGDTGFLAHFVPFIAILSKLLLKKVIFKSIGLYSTASALDRFFVNLSIAFADMCSVRDTESYQMLWRINRKNKAVQTDDLSLPFIKSIDHKDHDELPKISRYKEMRLLKDQGKFIVGISLKPMKDSELNQRIIGEFSRALNKLNNEHKYHLYFLFFPFAKTPPRTDEEFVRSIVSNLEYQNNVAIVGHTNPIAWYRAIKELTDIFIGMRYHSIILSFQAGKSVLSIPYERKVVQFLKQYNGTNCNVVFPYEISESHIVDFIQRHSFLDTQ